MPHQGQVQSPADPRNTRRAVPLLIGGLAMALSLSACTGERYLFCSG